jgi:capsule polysaccharide export protein KpsC/LpsZ
MTEERMAQALERIATLLENYIGEIEDVGEEEFIEMSHYKEILSVEGNLEYSGGDGYDGYSISIGNDIDGMNDLLELIKTAMLEAYKVKLMGSELYSTILHNCRFTLEVKL